MRKNNKALLGILLTMGMVVGCTPKTSSSVAGSSPVSNSSISSSTVVESSSSK